MGYGALVSSWVMLVELLGLRVQKGRNVASRSEDQDECST